MHECVCAWVCTCMSEYVHGCARVRGEIYVKMGDCSLECVDFPLGDKKIV